MPLMLTERSFSFLVPKLCLGTHLSTKLCFVTPLAATRRTATQEMLPVATRAPRNTASAQATRPTRASPGCYADTPAFAASSRR